MNTVKLPILVTLQSAVMASALAQPTAQDLALFEKCVIGAVQDVDGEAVLVTREAVWDLAPNVALVRPDVEPGWMGTSEVAPLESDSLWFVGSDGNAYRTPVELARYFRALHGSRTDEELPAICLDGPPIARRMALLTCNGGAKPWPFTDLDVSELPLKLGEGSRLRRGEAAMRDMALREAAAPAGDHAAAALALAVLHSFRSSKVIDVAAELAKSSSPECRLVALCVQGEHGQIPSFEVVESLVLDSERLGPGAPILLNELIDVLGREGAVEQLIAFLERGLKRTEFGTDATGVPAIRARSWLRKLVGHVFPYEVQGSREAWSAARRGKPSEVPRALSMRAPGIDQPLEAYISEGRVVLKNVSATAVTILLPPTNLATKVGRASYFGRPAGAGQTRTLSPGESLVACECGEADWVQVNLFELPTDSDQAIWLGSVEGW